METTKNFNALPYNSEGIFEAVKSRNPDIQNVNFQAAVSGTTFVRGNKELLPHLKNEVGQNDIMLLFEHETDNPYDKNAVIVRVTETGSNKIDRIGYVDRNMAPIVAYVLDHPTEYKLNVTEIRFYGGEAGKENIGIRFGFMVEEV